jgi:hypothetical protein
LDGDFPTEQAEQDLIRRPRELGMVLETLALEILDCIGLAVRRILLIEGIRDRHTEDGQPAVLVPVLLEHTAEAVAAPGEPRLLRCVGEGGDPVEGRLSGPPLRQFQREEAEVDRQAGKPAVTGVLRRIA